MKKKQYIKYGLIYFCIMLSLFFLRGTNQVFAASKVNLKKTKINLSIEKTTYNKKNQRPKVIVTYKGKKLKNNKNYIVKYPKNCKNVGTYAVQIVGKGKYIGTIKKKFMILPPQTKIRNSYGGKDYVNVVIKVSNMQTSGYQMRYSADAKLKKAKIITARGKQNINITARNLKSRRTYYIQVRTYMVVKGKKYYSQWSPTTRCKTTGKSDDANQTPELIPELTFIEGKSNVELENSDYYLIMTSNDIKNINISDMNVVCVMQKGMDYYQLKTLEPGKCVITITDVYGQKITSAVSVVQEIHNPHDGIFYETKSETMDSNLPVPTVKSMDYGEEWLNLNCPGTFSMSDSYIGYEGYLSDNDRFEGEIQASWTNGELEGIGIIGFGYLKNGCSYYVKIRSYTVRDNVKVVGPWSKIRKVDLPIYDIKGTQPIQYTYEIYGLDKKKTDIYSEYEETFFIKTDNPDPSSFDLVYKGESLLIDTGLGGSSDLYDDIFYENGSSETNTRLKKVKGGYIGYVNFPEVGTYNVEFREYALSGYTVAKKIKVNVLDYNLEEKAWMMDIINKTTTSDMTSFEKMEAVCEYLKQPGLFKYTTWHGNNRVNLAAEPNYPIFTSYRWNSYDSPTALCQFAELIGGFDDIHNCYSDYPDGSDDWVNSHYLAKLTIGSEVRYYSVCPATSTGEVKEIKMIDLTDTSNMIKFG